MTPRQKSVEPHALRRRIILVTAAAMGVAMLLAGILSAKRPLVFSESLWGHAHCIPQAGLALRMYATDHGGTFPTHTNGYGDALLLLTNLAALYSLTGPGYSESVFLEAARTGSEVPEAQCGRVYVQGLREDSDLEIVILFDKLPSPGGDHCHFPIRLWAPLSREVLFIDGRHRTIRESHWPKFAKEQIELLVKEGISREQAEAYYREKPTRGQRK